MLGFIIGVLVGIMFLLVNSSILIGLNIVETVFVIFGIILIYGCFGFIIDFMLFMLSKFK